ncbi:MAG: bifunctional diguanylate cyclase/phosphodiesterase [Erysipelotrichaceae bacterium]
MRRKNRFITFVVLTTLAVFLLLGMTSYMSFLKNTLLRQNLSTLEQINAQQIISVNQRLHSNETIIENLGNLLASVPVENANANAQIALSLMKESIKHTDFDRLYYATPQGRMVYGDGSELDISETEYFRKAILGETITSQLLQTREEGGNVICVSTPIEQNNKMVGVLIGLYDANILSSLMPHFDHDQGYAFLTAQDGTIIATSTNQATLVPGVNLLTYLQSVEFESGFDHYNDISTNLFSGIGGTFIYQKDDMARVGVYDSIGFNDWSVFTLLPVRALFSETVELIQTFSMITIVVFFLLFVYSLVHMLQLRRYAKALERSIYVDELTQGNTLAKFRLRAAKLLAQPQRPTYVICKYDIRNFRIINGIYGYAQGDEILRATYQAIESRLQSKTDLCARVNVDEFILMQELRSEADFLAQHHRLREEILTILDKDFENRCNLQLVMGYDVLEQGSHIKTDALIERVNMAHRKAKQSGQPWVKYQEGYTIEKTDQVEFERLMEQALRNGEYQIYLQPKYNIETSAIVGYEALVRWEDGSGTQIPPNRFIPLFEENGFIIKLDYYMFEQVCRIQQHVQEAGAQVVPISVNFSRHHLLNPQFTQELAQLAQTYQVPFDCLEIEMLENSAFQQDELFQKVYEQLHEIGFVLALDDFGTGYSSLGFLKSIPVDVLKLDRSFFEMQENEARGFTVLYHLIDMAQALNIQVIAEGIETKEQVMLLKEVGCIFAQGYYFGKPAPWKAYVGNAEDETNHA